MKIFIAFIVLFAVNINSYAQTPSVLWSFELNDIAFGCAAAADIDNDGKLEIVFSTYRNDNHLYALNSEDGSLLWKFDVGGCSDAAPIIYDIDNDGELEIILHSSCLANMFCINGESGTLKWKINTRGTDSPPSIADIYKDDNISIFDGDFRGYVSSFDANDGTLQWETLIEQGYFLQTAPVLSDIDNDEIPEIFVATYNLDSLCHSYSLDSRNGKILWKSKDSHYSVYHGPSIADIDDDGYKEVLFSDFEGILYCLNSADGTTKWKFQKEGCKNSLSPTTIADLENDGIYEIIYFCDNYLNVITNSGELKWDFKMINGIAAFRGGITVDVNNDSMLDVVFGNYSGQMTAVSGIDGKLIWNMDLSAIYGDYFIISHGLLAADFNDDGYIDIFTAGGYTLNDYKLNYGMAYLISTNSHGGPDWLMFRNNNYRNAVMPLENSSYINEENDFSIFPNPINDYIYIIDSKHKGFTEIEIYNYLGIKIYFKHESQLSNNYRLNLKDLSPGLYYLKIDKHIEKFIKL